MLFTFRFARHSAMTSLSRTHFGRSTYLDIGNTIARANDEPGNDDTADHAAEQTISPPRVVPDYNDDDNKQRRAAVVEQMAATSASVILSGGYASTHSMTTADRMENDGDDDDDIVEQAQRLSDKVLEEREPLAHPSTTNATSIDASNFDLSFAPRDSTMLHTSELNMTTSALPPPPMPDVLNYKDFETRCHVVHRTLPGSLVELIASQIFLGIRSGTGLNAMVKTIQHNLMSHDRLRILGDWVVCAGTNVGMSIEHATNLMMHVTFEGMHFIVYCLHARLPLKNGLRKVKEQLSSTWRSTTKSAASGDQLTMPSLFDEKPSVAGESFSRDQISFNNNSISGSRSSSIISSRGSKISNRSKTSNTNSGSNYDINSQTPSTIIADKNRYVANTVTAPSLLGMASSSQLLKTAADEEAEYNESSTSLTLPASASVTMQRDSNVLDRKSLQSLVRESWKEHFKRNASMQMNQAFRV